MFFKTRHSKIQYFVFTIFLKAIKQKIIRESMNISNGKFFPDLVILV